MIMIMEVDSVDCDFVFNENVVRALENDDEKNGKKWET